MGCSLAFSNTLLPSLGLLYLLCPLCSVPSVSCIPPPSVHSDRLCISFLTARVRRTPRLRVIWGQHRRAHVPCYVRRSSTPTCVEKTTEQRPPSTNVSARVIHRTSDAAKPDGTRRSRGSCKDVTLNSDEHASLVAYMDCTRSDLGSVCYSRSGLYIHASKRTCKCMCGSSCRSVRSY
ncbi:hypothetical protein BV20DRAFT_969670, partial [Pilatotrama ljubarskyi]